MGENSELTSAVVDAVSLERALKDAEVANQRVITLTKELLDREEKIAKLHATIVAMKRVMDPKRRAEYVLRKNHAVLAIARRTKRMIGR
ncbi:hypothetical protein [Herbiconiux sp. L3-i23]|uniref:hypothetical protein n=1 Tax=Herbiconiux sp. L3-i23 TaxID=2905871 RepID=UPI0020485622|nr:hypothetical protein [Herbiconiux sp. L3-i23]BDI21628.1 hypothetical protein L3i23_04040 [Herbiconiux sp. L3-i23]